MSEFLPIKSSLPFFFAFVGFGWLIDSSWKKIMNSRKLHHQQQQQQQQHQEASFFKLSGLPLKNPHRLSGPDPASPSPTISYRRHFRIIEKPDDGIDSHFFVSLEMSSI